MPLCTMTQAEPDARAVVTFDATLPEYAISITLTDRVWDVSPVFTIAFVGSAGLTISTGAHVLTDGGATLTVRDRGFGNVLNGLQFNATARAISGLTQVDIDLSDAAQVVEQFRECPSPLTS